MVVVVVVLLCRFLVKRCSLGVSSAGRCSPRRVPFFAKFPRVLGHLLPLLPLLPHFPDRSAVRGEKIERTEPPRNWHLAIGRWIRRGSGNGSSIRVREQRKVSSMTEL